MTTYDAAGLCTRCGSTGYTPERVYDVNGEGTDIRRLVPCPCHGWRPIDTAPSGEWIRLLIMVHVGLSVTNIQPTGRRVLGNWEIIQEPSGRLPRGLPQPTHWQPLPQPPGVE